MRYLRLNGPGAFLLSFVSHLLLALALLHKRPQNPSQAASASDAPPQEIEILPPAEEAAPSIQAQEKGPGPQSDKDCGESSWYGGIGVRHDLLTDELTEVFPGYAADQAGLHVGDIVLNDPNSIRGEPGTQVLVRVVRGGVEMPFLIMRQKICFNE